MADVISYSSRLSDDGSLESMLAEHRRDGIANCQEIWEKATRLKKFAARQQWPDKDKEKVDNRKSPRMTIPETSRILAAFSGRQILERVEREYIPRNQSAARFAETLTKVDRAVCQAADGEQIDSAAFRDGPGIQGISWVRWYVDEWSSDKPQLKFNTVPIWSMMWPPTREINLRDRGWHRWGSWWPQSTVKDKWPDKYEQIKARIGVKSWTAASNDHGQSSRIPWTGQAGNKPLSLADHYDPKGRSFWIEYEEWRELVTLYQLVRPSDPTMTYAQAAAIRVMPSNDPSVPPPPDPFERVELTKAELAEFKAAHFAMHAEQVPADMSVRKPRMMYRYAYICGDVVLENGDLEIGCFSHLAMAAEVVELSDKTLYIGLLEDLVDAQQMINYMMSALIRDIQINPKGVLFVEQGLFRDKDAALNAFTSPGGVIEIPRGRLQTGAQPYQWVAGGTGAYSSKLENMLAFYREALPRLAGFNPAALGQLGNDIRRVSGEVVRQLTDATLTSNAERIDALRLYRREGGRIFLAFARLLWEPEDLIDVIGEEDAYDDVIDPMTGEPAIDPTTGAPMRQLAIPPKALWYPEAWKEIAIEEVAPSDDELSALWDTLQTQTQLLLQPMGDTGQPLFTSEDFVDIIPKIPAARRQKMRLRIKQQVQQMRIQQQQAAAVAQQQGVAQSEQSTPAPNEPTQ